MKKERLLVVLIISFCLLPLSAAGKKKQESPQSVPEVTDWSKNATKERDEAIKKREEEEKYWKEHPEECPQVYYTFNLQSRKYEFFLQVDEEENLDVKEARPAYLNYKILEDNNLKICSYRTDSHKSLIDYFEFAISGYVARYNQDWYFWWGDEVVSYRRSAQEILDETIPGKSHIITFVCALRNDCDNDSGIHGVVSKVECIKKYPESAEFLKEVESEYINLQYSFGKKWTRIETVVEDFENEEAAINNFFYGTAEEVNVKIPKGNIKVNKNALPKKVIAEDRKITLGQDDYLSCSEEHMLNILSETLEQVRTKKLDYEWLNLGMHCYLISDIKIIKREGDYYISNNGWKIHVSSTGYREYFDSLLKEKKEICPYVEKMCYTLRMLESNGTYEFVLEASPYSMK